MDASGNTRSISQRIKDRIWIFAGAAVVLVGIAVFAGWWFLFRDTAPAAVDTAEAADARQAAIDEAVGAPAEAEPEPAPEPEVTEPELEPPPAEEPAQPDVPAVVGNPLDGVWQVDTTIGSFDQSCLTEVCSSTFVGFRIDEELASIGAKTVVGRTPGVSGSMEIAGTQIAAASFVVDMTQLLTDSNGRTEALQSRSGGLETATFPEALFVLSQPVELGEVPVEGQAIQVEAVGDLTVHGVTRNVTIPLTAEHQAGVVVVFGSLEDMLLADYDIPTPSAAVVISVEDHATMELQLFFTR